VGEFAAVVVGRGGYRSNPETIIQPRKKQDGLSLLHNTLIEQKSRIIDAITRLNIIELLTPLPRFWFIALAKHARLPLIDLRQHTHG
jgi:hypothetical protein